MMQLVPLGLIASGVVFLTRMNCSGSRTVGAGLVGAATLLMATPAFADQSVMAADNGKVLCEVSKSDLTRISLKEDRFAAVSKVETGNPLEDFSVVHEPTRGDLYISVPEGFSRSSVSFFGTTEKGYVYKFRCQVSGDEAKQVFVANADIEHPRPAAAQLPASAPLGDQAVSLVRAMFEQRPVHGFEIQDQARAPVNVGTLKVQLVSQYVSPTLSGKVLRVENTGDQPLTLAEELIASDGAIAVSISNPELQPGQATAAYVVVPAGGF